MSERIEFDDLENLGPSETLGDELNARYNALKTVALEALAIIGAWDSGTNYYLNDGVASGGVTWRSLQDDNVNHTPAAGAWWEKLAGDVVSSGDFAAHVALTTAHGATAAATASRLALRGAGGTLKAAAAAADDDLVTLAQLNAKFLNLDWQEAVEDKDLATPPGSPVTGARYIVATSSTGAWSGHAKDIAEWSGSAWVFATPTEGFATRVKDENKFYAYDGSAWGVFGGGSGESLSKEFAQTAHGLAVQNVVCLSGGVFIKAQDDTAAHAEAVGVVSVVRDADHVTVTFAGYIEGLSGLTADEGYFVGPTAGALTSTAPTADGKVSKPVMVAISATQAMVLIQGGHIISTASYQPLDATLTALATLDGTVGILVQTGPDAFARRSIVGTAHQTAVGNGTGETGNISVGIASDYAGQTSIIHLGTVNVGVWDATKIALAKGGTNADLSGTGPGFLKQVSVGADVVVAILTAADISDFNAAVQALLNTMDVKSGYQYATTTALPANTYSNGSSGVGATLTGTANGPLSVDSVLLTAGAKMLVKNEADPTHNGWYTLTQQGVVAVSPYILTRSTDGDVAAEMGAGFLTPIEGPMGSLGVANNGTLWLSLGPSPFVVGTSSITFAQEDASGAMLKANNGSDIVSASAFRSNLGLAALAVLATVGTAQIDNDAVTYAKIQNVSATDKLLGRSTVGAGDVEEIALTAAGRALIDDTDAATQRATLGFGATMGRPYEAVGGAALTVPGAEISAQGTGNTAANVLFYEPFTVEPPGLTIDQLVIECTTLSASTNARVGIYNADANWQPTTLVIDGGTVSLGSTGVKTVSISQALTPGRYLFAIVADSSVPALRQWKGGSKFSGLMAALGASAFTRKLTVAFAYSTLPGAGTAWDTRTGVSTPMERFVLCRVASIP